MTNSSIAKLILCAAVAASSAAVAAAPKGKAKNKAKARTTQVAPARTPAEIDRLTRELISKMTLEEKIGQLDQLSGYGYAAPMTDLVRAGKIGSILNEVDPATVNRLQRLAVDSSRLHIPLIFARDVIHGFKTIFPIPLGQACTWDEALVEEGARIAADEASSVGVRWTFSPMLDIARDARWGRIAEGFGEDTHLTSRLGAAMVRGYQGPDISAPNTMAACAKHFAAYGAAEGGRDYNTTWIPANQLNDIYLPPFKAAKDAGALTFMCSFNDINGIPSSGNTALLKGILRDQWGFDGVMVSDWGSIEQMIPHGYSADLRQAARQAATAGVDIDMESHAYSSHLKELVESGVVPVATIDSMVANVIKMKYRLGLFDNPYVDMKTASRFYAPSSLEAARRCAREAAVLLKNDGVLPLQAATRVAVIGPMADAAHDQNGTWCFDLDKSHTVTPLTAIKECFGPENVVTAKGLDFSRDRSTKGFDEAVKAASQADVVLYFCGEEAVLSGEAHCRVDVGLPGAQTELLRKLREAGKPVVMVVMAGRPLELAEESELADAILFNFHPGTMGGPAIADLLSGKANPSGRMPVSMPRMSGQAPLYYNRTATGRPAAGITLIDSIPLEAGQTSTGCTSFYLDAGDGPLYPFGYGLSYTTFSYGTPQISATEIPADGTITVTCDVTNTGNREGTEVAQLYVRDKVGSLVRPVRELKGYEKFTLAPGATRTVSFTLPAKSLAFYRADGTVGVEPGDFTLWVAPNAQAGTPVNFKLTEPSTASR